MNAQNDGFPNNIPDYVIESLARYLLPKLQEFYRSQEGKREFEERKENQAEDNPC